MRPLTGPAYHQDITENTCQAQCQEKKADLSSNSHGSDEDPFHPKGREESLQVARQAEGHRLTPLQDTPALTPSMHQATACHDSSCSFS